MAEGVDAKLEGLAAAWELARYVLVSAGAGWSAESGLGTYRGSAFYALDADGAEGPMEYRDVCIPQWGLDTEGGRERVFKPFWSKCAEAYRAATPHAGHRILHALVEEKEYFLYTSNVDGHFLRTGFPRSQVCEIHGSIDHAQCCRPEKCPAGAGPDALIPLPQQAAFVDACPHCSGPARPHVVMFGDNDCIKTPHMADEYQAWVDRITADGGGRLLIVEFGCGQVVPSVREEGEWVLKDYLAAHGADSAAMYRVNVSADDAHLVHDSALAGVVVPLVMPALAVLKALEKTASE